MRARIFLLFLILFVFEIGQASKRRHSRPTTRKQRARQDARQQGRQTQGAAPGPVPVKAVVTSATADARVYTSKPHVFAANIWTAFLQTANDLDADEEGGLTPMMPHMAAPPVLLADAITADTAEHVGAHFVYRAAPHILLNTQADLEPRLIHYVSRAVTDDLQKVLHKELQEPLKTQVVEALMQQILKKNAKNGDDDVGSERDNTNSASPPEEQDERVEDALADGIINICASTLTDRLTHSIGFNAFDMLTGTIAKSLTRTIGSAITEQLYNIIKNMHQEDTFSQYYECYYKFYDAMFIEKGAEKGAPPECGQMFPNLQYQFDPYAGASPPKQVDK